jgi:hypothetical protein
LKQDRRDVFRERDRLGVHRRGNERCGEAIRGRAAEWWNAKAPRQTGAITRKVSLGWGHCANGEDDLEPARAHHCDGRGFDAG